MAGLALSVVPDAWFDSMCLAGLRLDLSTLNRHHSDGRPLTGTDEEIRDDRGTMEN